MRLGRALVLSALVAGPAVLGACQQPPLACGVYPPGGGPAVIHTRDQQLCELVRQRVLQFMARSDDLTFERAETIAEKAPRWRRADTLDELVVLIRREAGDALADLVVRAVAAVEGPAGKPLPADCPDIQECLVEGAVKGAEIALAQRGWYVRGGRPDGDTVHPGTGGRVRIEDLID